MGDTMSHRASTPRVDRSPGVPITVGGLPTGLRAGGGFIGRTTNLDDTVQHAAQALSSAYKRAVTIRFNSDRGSGGAWLVLSRSRANRLIGADSELGVCASEYSTEDRDRLLAMRGLSPRLRDELEAKPLGISIQAHLMPQLANDDAALAHIDGWHESRSGGYLHAELESIDDAIALLLQHAPADQVMARSQRARRSRRERSRAAAKRCVHKRTFEARKHPEGSAERARLNQDPRTSEYMRSYRWCVISAHSRQTFRTEAEAIASAMPTVAV
jgi:hypothetical protein